MSMYPDAMMTREEALKAVEDFLLYLEFSGAAPKHADKLRDALAALSQPCEEPIARGWASERQLGNFKEGRSGSLLIWEKPLIDDEGREVVVLPAADSNQEVTP